MSKGFESKYCYKCDRERIVELFYKNKSSSDGLSDMCKECNRQNSKNIVRFQSAKLMAKGGIRKIDCVEINDAFVEVMAEAFANEETVTICNFGKFDKREIKKSMTRSEHTTIGFRGCEQFRADINKALSER